MKMQKISESKYIINSDISQNNRFDPNVLLNVIDECADGTEIVFEAGNYYFPAAENAVKLRGIKKNITFKSAAGARFIGGKPVFGAAAVSGETKKRFFPDAQDKVFCVDLKSSGVSDAGGFVSRGFGRAVVPSHSEIFAGGIPLNLSRYPKNGYLKITDYAEESVNEWSQKVGSISKGFFYESEQPKKWADADDILVHGYWSWDWANSYEKIDVIDKQSGKIITKEPYALSAFKRGQRFNFYNILEEVTQPGDYYIDRKTMTLYFIPFDAANLSEEILISTLDEPLWTIDGCENLCFKGFAIEVSRGGGMAVINSGNIKIADCEIKNIGNYPLTLENSRDITVMSCDIHDCGDGGIKVVCGDRVSLEAGNIKIDNNHIYKVAKWTRTYQTAVNAAGVGIDITNNLIHDCPHTGILFWGNDIRIKNNEIYSALLETGDAGAVYTGRDYTFRGNVVSNNYIHHLGGVGMGTMGIYNDDCVSGTVMEENIFFEVSRAVFLGGGRNFRVSGNLFADCHPSIEIDGRGTSEHPMWRRMTDELMRDRFYNIHGVSDNGNAASGKDGRKTADATCEPYISKYPELAEIDAFYADNLPIPPSAVIENNVYCSKRKLEFTWDSEPGEFTINKNKSISRDCFEDFGIGLFNIKDGSDAEMYGFKRIDMFSCGLDEKRRGKNPPRVLTGLRFDGENLIYRYKNFSDIKTAAKITLYTSENDVEIILGVFEVSIEAAAEDTVKIPFDTAAPSGMTIDARADAAGVRPCRLRV